jgi:hypothetical protein
LDEIKELLYLGRTSCSYCDDDPKQEDALALIFIQEPLFRYPPSVIRSFIVDAGTLVGLAELARRTLAALE